MVVKAGIGIAKAGWGAVKNALKPKKVSNTITSVTPTLTKGESTRVKLHKFKGAIKKGSDDAEDAIRTGVKKFKKSIDKMKDPK